jgi:hypothetical protein
MGAEFLLVITYYAPGPIRAIAIPTAMANPALFMGMLYLGAAYLCARYDRPVSPLALLLKAEAIRWINSNMKDPEKAVSNENIGAITYLSTGARVSLTCSSCTA